MKQSRREFLSQGGRATLAMGLGACGAGPGEETGSAPEDSPERSSEPAPYTPVEGTLDEDLFPRGLQIGDVTSSSALVSLFSNSESVRLTLLIGQNDVWDQEREESFTVEDNRLHIELDGLQPDTAYSLVFFSEDGQSHSLVARFRTALAETASRKIVFGATSCMGGNWPWPGLTNAASEGLDFFVFLGDTTYAAASTLSQYRQDWAVVMSTQGMVDLTASTSIVATWDDHEVANNWSMDSIGEERYAAALQAFRECLPQREGETGGIWRSLQWGAALELFVLDCRSERAEGQYISNTQMEWLKSGIQSSSARFKIICNSVPITDMSAMIGVAQAEDRWQGYPEQREEILRHIEDEGIEGVLWITGDVHFGQIGWVSPEGQVGQSAWEVYCGPTGSFLNR